MNQDNLTNEQRFVKHGIILPSRPPKPMAAYVNIRQTGNLLYVSGQGPVLEDGSIKTGKVGADVTAEQAQEHARLVGLNILSVLKDYCGSLDKISSVVKILGLVNAVADFKRHPFVIDGCSNLFIEVFGEQGRHARSAMGMGSLPNQITVEIESIFEINA